MKISKTGYKKNSKDKNEPALVIPSNKITMKDVDFPVYGTDDTGYSQMMYPGLDYSFPGSYVYELPMAQDGGYMLPGRFKNPEGNWVSKYANGGPGDSKRVTINTNQQTSNDRNVFQESSVIQNPNNIEDAIKMYTRSVSVPGKEEKFMEYFQTPDSSSFKYNHPFFGQHEIVTRNPLLKKLGDKYFSSKFDMGGDISIPDLSKSSWLDKYQSAGEVIPVTDRNDPRLLDYQKRMNLWKYSQIPNIWLKEDLGNTEDIISGNYDLDKLIERAKDIWEEKFPDEITQRTTNELLGPYGSLSEKHNIPKDKLNQFIKNYEKDPNFSSRIGLAWNPSVHDEEDAQLIKDILKTYPPDSYQAISEYHPDPYRSTYAVNKVNYGSPYYHISPKTEFIEDNIDREKLKKIYPLLTDEDIDRHVSSKREVPVYKTNVYDFADNQYFFEDVYSQNKLPDDFDPETDTAIPTVNGLFPKEFPVRAYGIENPVMGYLQEAETDHITAFMDYYPMWNKPDYSVYYRPTFKENYIPSKEGRLEVKKPELKASTTDLGISKTKPIMKAASDTSKGQYQIGNYLWDDKRKQWTTKYFTPDRQKENYEDVKIPSKKQIKVPPQMQKGGWLDSYQKGGEIEKNAAVSTIWKQITGTPWSEAKAQGLTDGSFEANLDLRKRLLSGEFGKVSFKKQSPAPATKKTEEPVAKAEKPKRIKDPLRYELMRVDQPTAVAASTNVVVPNIVNAPKRAATVKPEVPEYTKPPAKSKKESYPPENYSKISSRPGVSGSTVTVFVDPKTGEEWTSPEQQATQEEYSNLSRSNNVDRIGTAILAGSLAAPVVAPLAQTALPYLNAPAVLPYFGEVPWLTAGNVLGAAGATDFMVNRLPEIPGQVSRGEYADAAANTLMGALDISGANMANIGTSFVPKAMSQLDKAYNFGKGFTSGALPAVSERVISKIVTPTGKLSLLEKETLDKVDNLSALVDKYRTIKTSRGVGKKGMQNLLANESDRTALVTLSENLHPDVVKRILGTDVFDGVKSMLNTSTDGLSGTSLTKTQQALYGLNDKLQKYAKSLKNSSNDPAMYQYGKKMGSQYFPRGNQKISFDGADSDVISLIDDLRNADKNTFSKLRAATQTVLSAAPGERFVGSTSLSNNSWTTTAKKMDEFMTKGIIKYDGYKMGPLNHQAYSYQTNVPEIIAADVKKINNQIAELNRKHKLNLPKAWVNPTSLEVIAPYVITKKMPKPTKLKYGGWLDKYQDAGEVKDQTGLIYESPTEPGLYESKYSLNPVNVTPNWTEAELERNRLRDEYIKKDKKVWAHWYDKLGYDRRNVDKRAKQYAYNTLAKQYLKGEKENLTPEQRKFIERSEYANRLQPSVGSRFVEGITNPGFNLETLSNLAAPFEYPTNLVRGAVKGELADAVMGETPSPYFVSSDRPGTSPTEAAIMSGLVDFGVDAGLGALGEITPMTKGFNAAGKYITKQLPGSPNAETELDAIRRLLKAGNDREVSKVLNKKALPVTTSEQPFSKTYPELSPRYKIEKSNFDTESVFWTDYNKREHGIDYDRPIPIFYDPTVHPPEFHPSVMKYEKPWTPEELEEIAAKKAAAERIKSHLKTVPFEQRRFKKNGGGLDNYKKGGAKSQGEGYYDYINGYSGIFANGGTKSKENSWLNKYK